MNIFDTGANIFDRKRKEKNADRRICSDLFWLETGGRFIKMYCEFLFDFSRIASPMFCKKDSPIEISVNNDLKESIKTGIKFSLKVNIDQGDKYQFCRNNPWWGGTLGSQNSIYHSGARKTLNPFIAWTKMISSLISTISN